MNDIEALAQTGKFRVEAETLADAETLLAGNPVFENGGTVELRELPKGI